MKRQKGALICLLGVDGCGKTTMATRLRHRLEREGLNCDYMNLNYSLFQFIPLILRRTVGKPLVAISEAKADKTSPSLGSRRIKKTTLLLLCLTLLLHLADSLIMYFFKVRPAVRKSIVVHDRYFYDYAIFYLDVCPPWLLWCYRRLIPKPDMTFFLDVDPEVAQARDREYSLDFYRLCGKSYLDFAKGLNPGVVSICNTNRSEEEIASLIYDRVLEVIEGGAKNA